MKKYLDSLKEYVKKLNDEELKYINVRLSHRVGSDVGEVAEFVQRNSDMDRWLASASNADEFFDMIDQIDNYTQQEAKKRFGYGEKKEKSR